MKKPAVALACIAAGVSANSIIARNLPLIKTLATPQNYKDYRNPYSYYGVSRCEFSNSTQPNINEFQKIAGSRWKCYTSNPGTRDNFCLPKAQIRDLTSVEFVKVTANLCAKYNGFLMIEQGPSTA